MRARPIASQALPKPAYVPFNEGLDLETPAWEVRRGRLRDSQNYERAVKGGYQDIMGYERFDGRPAPSSANYATLDVTITGSISVGDTITGATSGATAKVLLVDTSGSQAFLVITKVSGAFVASENLEVSTVVEATTDGLAVTDGAATIKLHGEYNNLAADEYRSDIGVVPGEGSVLGVWMLNDVKYAIRNATGGAEARMYRHSTSGWTQVDLGEEMDFTSGGTYVVSEGDTITGQTSASTAIVRRVVLTSGSWSGGDAAGRFILASVSGAFTAGELLDVGANANVATATADATAITLLPDGTFEFFNSNFADSTGAERMYGVDGVNRGWEFDGTTFVPINTGMTVDAPEHVVVHRQHLFFSFGSSLQHSGIGDPYSFTILSGAAEIATDGQITGFMREPGSEGNATLGVYTRNRIHILYGTDAASWDLVNYRDEVGAYARTIQQLSYTLYLDDRGVTNLRTVQAFGNFQHATLTVDIQRFINEKRLLATNSCIVRDKNQYRLFFTDNSGLYITFDGRKIVAPMPVMLDHQVTCMCSLEASSGLEEIYFGSTDGYVYQMERGTSFDGAAITAFFTTHFTNEQIRVLKTFLNGVTIEAVGTGYAEIDFTYELDYADPETPQPAVQNQVVEFSPGVNWDDPGVTWDTLFWDGRTLLPTSGMELRGTAENISFTIRKTSDSYPPVRMTGIHYYSTERRVIR